MQNLSNILKTTEEEFSTFISVSTTTINRLNSSYNDLMGILQNIDKINSSEELEIVLKKLRSFNELLPTGPRNFTQLMDENGNIYEYFASEVFPIVLDTIIEKIGKQQQNSIPEEVMKIVNITNNVDFITETLNTLSCGNLMNKCCTFIAQILQNLIQDESYLLFCFIRLSHIENNNIKWIKIENYIQQLISLPDKIANRLKSDFPEAFKADAFASILLLNALKSIHIMTHINNIEKSEMYDFSFTSKLISKIMVNFKTSRAINNAIKILSLQSTQTFYQNNVRDIIKHLQRGAIEIIALQAFENESHKQNLIKLFGNIWKLSNEWIYVLTKKIPLFNYSKSDKLIENLVFFLAAEDIKLMEDILMDMLLIWSTKSHVFDTSFEQHFYVTKFIVLMVSYLPNVKDHAENIRQHLFNGAQLHIGSTDEKLRALGMISSEIVLGIIDSNMKEEDKLKFEYSEFSTFVVEEIVDLIRNFPKRRVLKDNMEVDEMNTNEIDEFMHALIFISHNKPENSIKVDVNTQKENIKAENSPVPILQEAKRNIPKNQDLDSDDDDLEAYPDVNDDNSNADKSRPIYILDIINALNSKEDLENVEKFEAIMASAQEIIKQQLTNNHTDIAIDLLRTFLNLQKLVYCENYDELKMNAMLETCSTYPKECASYICQEFNTEATKYSMHTRILMLTVLSESAKRLCKLVIPNRDDNEVSPTKQQSHGLNKLTIKLRDELDNRNKRDAQKIIRERLIAKTRRIATRTKTSDETSGVNKFSNVAGWFFFPLVQGFGKQQMAFSSKTNLKHDIDNILLVKFLNTISVLMLCAENSTIAPKMAKEIVNLSVFLRYHEESQIRLAVLHMFVTIILAVPKNILIKEFHLELTEFMNHLEMIVKSTVVNYEPDKECREFAKQLIAICYSTLYGNDDDKV